MFRGRHGWSAGSWWTAGRGGMDRERPDVRATVPLEITVPPAKVGHASGLYQVIPVGIFQASSDRSWNEQNGFLLWRCLLREFAEELLGQDEPDPSPTPRTAPSTTASSPSRPGSTPS